MKPEIERRLKACKAIVLICLAFPLAANAADITWTSLTGGNWSAATNWSPQQVPTAADDVFLAADTSVLTIDVAAFANSLTLGEGGQTLTGPGPLTLSGPLNWSGGIISTVIYCNGGEVDDPEGLDGGQLINSGTLNRTPNPDTGNGSIISNASTGTITIALNGDDITRNSYGGTATFYNAGQINGSGSGTGTIGDTFINTGTVTVSSGTLEAAVGGTNFGTMTASGSGGIGVGGGTFYFTGSSVVSGTGAFIVNGGTANIGGALNVTGNWTVDDGTANFTGTSTTGGQTLNINGAANFVGAGPWIPGAVNLDGTLAGTSPVIASGALDWTGGTITGVLTCNGGTLDNPQGINGGTLINTGSLNWIPYPDTGNGSIISNASTGTINFQINGDDITRNSFGGAATFYNAGQINGSGSGTGTIGDTFINTGTVTVSSGTLEAAAGGTNFGTMIANGSGGVGLGGGTFYFANSSVVFGSGAFVVTEGTANVSGALNITGSWTVNEGTANFSGTSTAAGQTLNIVGGAANFVGAGPWITGAVNLDGTLAGTSPVIASGALDWTGGTITGVLSCNGGTVDDPQGINGGTLINTGPLNWIPYPDTGGGSIISNAPTGTINLPLNDQTLTRNSFGGAATFYNAGQINASGSGTGSLGDTLINSGTLNLQGGTIDATAGAFLEAGSILDVTATNATNFATLAISGPTSLAGLVDLSFNGYTPRAGDSFRLITYASESGVFGDFILPAQADWQAVYGQTAFSLDVTGLASPYLTLEALPLEIDTNGFNLMLIGPSGSNYTIQASTDLKSWTSLTNFRTTYSSFIFDDLSSTNDSHRSYRATISQ